MKHLKLHDSERMKHPHSHRTSIILGSSLAGLAAASLILAPDAKAISIINWQNQALDSSPSSITQNGVTTTFSYTGAFTASTPRVANSHSDSLVGSTPAQALRLSQSGPNVGDSVTTRLTFDIPLDNLRLEIFDVDARKNPPFLSIPNNPGFVDIVNLQGFNGATAVTPTLTPKGINPAARPTISGTTATGQLRIFDNPNDTGGGTNPPGDRTNFATEATITYTFSATVTSLDLTYTVGNPQLVAGLAQQTIALGNIQAVPFPSSPLGLLVLGAVAAYKKFRLSQK